MPKVKLIQALRDAIDEELQRDESVCYFGEDVGEFGGVWGTATKLQKKYGRQRVFDTPLSEGAIVGTAVGAAMTGLRPIAEIMYIDFIAVGMDPLINQAAKLRFMSGGQIELPLVIFAQFGSETREAAQHSQSPEAWFVHTPGLKVVMPSSVADAKGLLKASIRDNNPVVYLWHRQLYGKVEEVPEGDHVVPLGKAEVKRQGADITVVATSYMVYKTLAAAKALEGKIDVEVIDPRTLVPMDWETILTSVRKTGKLLVVHEAPVRCGIGADIVRYVTGEAFGDLKRAPQVLGGANLPMPFSEPLETTCVPQEEDICEAVEAVVSGKKLKPLAN